MKNKKVGGLILIGLLAVGLRCLFIDTRGLIYDDAFSILLSRLPLTDIITGTAADTMPPLYYFLLHLWMMGGDSIWFIRLPGILLSLVGICLLYVVINELFGEKAAMVSAFLASISPLQIYHAQDVRMYTLMQAGQLAFIWFFIKLWKNEKGHRPIFYWMGLTLSGTISLYSHNLAGFILLPPIIFLLWKKEWRKTGSILLAYLLIGLLFLPWALYLPGQLNKVQAAFWTPRPGLVEVLQVMIQFTANLPLANLYWLGTVAVLALFLCIVLGMELAKDKQKPDEKMLLFLLILATPFCTFLISYFYRPVFVARGFIVNSMFFLGLVGWVTSLNWKKITGWIPVFILMFCACIGLPYQMPFNQFPRSPFEQAGYYLAQNAKADDGIIHDNKLSFFPLHFYQPDLEEGFIQDEPGSGNDTLAPATQRVLNLFPQTDIRTAAGNKNSLYFIVFSETIREYGQMDKKHPALEWLESKYRLHDHIYINDLELFYFVKPG